MTRPPVIAPIVEGHGEVLAVREIVTRIGLELLGGTWIDVVQPFRLDSGKMRKPDELAKAIRIAAARVQGPGGVLVLRDGDDADVDCPVQLADAGIIQGDLASAEVLRSHRPQDGQQKQQIVPPHGPRGGDAGEMRPGLGGGMNFRVPGENNGRTPNRTICAWLRSPNG